MTKEKRHEKKTLALTFWKWAAETGKDKEDFIVEHPDGKKLKSCYSFCPLCDIFYNTECKGCSLKSCTKENNLYWKWLKAANNESRKKCAGIIAKKIEQWEV